MSAPTSPDLSHLAGKHIVIAGAGIAGLAFAISLHRQWPTVDPIPELPEITIYERDSKDDRLGREGYSLSIRSDGDRGGGVQVLDDLGIYEVVRDAAVIIDGGNDNELKGQERSKEQNGKFVLWDGHWETILSADFTKMANNGRRKLSGMRIRRNALQECLADAVEGLPGVTICWSHVVVGASKAEGHAGDEVTVMLGTGSQVSCHLLIAADGSQSKLRNHLRPRDTLDFAGVVILSGTAKFDSREDIPGSLAKDWGLVLSWIGTCLFVSPVDQTSSLWSLSYRTVLPRDIPKKPYSDAAEMLDKARHLGAFAGERLRTLIDATDPGTLMNFNAYDRPPFTHNIDQHGCIVWIGDANHAVTPFAGNGANMALMDSWDLAKALIGGVNFKEGVRDFEGTMVPRTSKVLKESHDSIDLGHATGMKAWLYWIMFKGLGLLMRLGWSA